MKTIKQLSVLLFSTLLALPHFAFSNTALKDENLHIYFCGTGNPDPSKQWLRHPSCLAVAYDNQFFLIDSGAGASLRLSEMGLPVHQISHVFLTHLHSDHFAGLGPIINESWIFGRTAKLKVHGPYGLKKVIHGIHESYAPDVWFRSINRQGKLNPNISGASTHIIDLKGKKNKTVFQDK
jgi:ribonuclease Z